MKNFMLMAFSAGQVSKEAGVTSRYIGVGSVTVDCINPNKAELEKLFNHDLENEPSYTGVAEQKDGSKIRYARVNLVLHTVPESNDGIDAISQMSLFVREQYRFNREQSKIQVIDKYGRTAWVTKEELDKHVIPTYSNGKPANIDADYRPCYQGEEDLTNFFKAFLNIPSPTVYKNQEWVPNEHPEDCLARFDNIKKLFDGDFSEIITAWKLQQANKVKVLFGIRTANDGKQYQAQYTRMFLRNGASSYDRLENDLKASTDGGAFPNTEFKVVPLQEYVVSGTSLENSKPAGENPFGNPAENKFF